MSELSEKTCDECGFVLDRIEAAAGNVCTECACYAGGYADGQAAAGTAEPGRVEVRVGGVLYVPVCESMPSVPGLREALHRAVAAEYWGDLGEKWQAARDTGDRYMDGVRVVVTDSHDVAADHPTVDEFVERLLAAVSATPAAGVPSRIGYEVGEIVLDENHTPGRSRVVAEFTGGVKEMRRFVDALNTLPSALATEAVTQ